MTEVSPGIEGRAATASGAVNEPVQPDQPAPLPGGGAAARQTPPRLGIIGGGQLAKMTAQAAAQLGVAVLVLERAEDCPAAPLAAEFHAGDLNDAGALLRFAARAEVLTLENEFVDAGLLGRLEAAGHRLFPSARCLGLVQDKLAQKEALAAAGLPVPRFGAVHSPAEVVAAGAQLGWPLLLKARRNAYDGKGNATLAGPEEVAPAWERLDGGRGRALYVEAFCDFEAELAVMVTRGRDGGMVTYPVVETVQREHICHEVRVPAAVPEAMAAHAADLARRAAEVAGVVGSFGVEMFLSRGGGLYVNELAPRVHNSGHYTIEACCCSQFENHVRAVLGWPLGDPALVAPAAVMVNLLGAGPGPGWPAGVAEALAVPGAHLHLYGKSRSARGRKMGHVTALGATLAEALATARRASACLRFGLPES